MKPHPDRVALTLAQRAELAAALGKGPFQTPGSGSADARIDLKLLAWSVDQALTRRGTEAAVQRIADLKGADLWAGTVQDGTARGFMAALEEAMSLCPSDEPCEDLDRDTDEVFEGKSLQRKRDILVASAGARVRYRRKTGILFVDRDSGIHSDDCLRFEDRADSGNLDGFVPANGERARLFSPAFLKPVLLRRGKGRDLLVQEGRLGGGKNGYPCRLTTEGRKDEKFIRLTVAIENRHRNHRLRLRFLGFPDSGYIEHQCMPVWETVREKGMGFIAASLVRACGQLRVGDQMVGTPSAQCMSWIEHRFTLGVL